MHCSAPTVSPSFNCFAIIFRSVVILHLTQEKVVNSSLRGKNPENGSSMACAPSIQKWFRNIHFSDILMHTGPPSAYVYPPFTSSSWLILLSEQSLWWSAISLLVWSLLQHWSVVLELPYFSSPCCSASWSIPSKIILPDMHSIPWHCSEHTPHPWLEFWGAQKPWGKILKAQCSASSLKSSPTHDFFLFIRENRDCAPAMLSNLPLSYGTHLPHNCYFFSVRAVI